MKSILGLSGKSSIFEKSETELIILVTMMKNRKL